MGHGTSDTRDFLVYINPRDWLTKHNVGIIGSFTSVPPGTEQKLMFLPNPEFKTFISAFQNNLLRNYVAEYNLESRRQRDHPAYPSRLHAIFLFDSDSEAENYAKRHPDHVGDRLLKRVKTVGPYLYSLHDSSWVDFLRLNLSSDRATLDFVGRSYWSGERVRDHSLTAMGNSWSQDPIEEVLFLGRVDFYDKSLDT